MTRTMLIAGPTALFTLASLLFAQDKPSDRDTTPHSARFVAVDDNIKLEVLDWGGSGRPIILLPAATALLTISTSLPRN